MIGWMGSLAILTAYALNSYQKITSGSSVFLTLNVAGGIFLSIYSFYHEAFANTFLNVIWVAIAIPPLLKLFRKH